MKNIFVFVMLISTFACASFSNKEVYVTLQKETQTNCIYGRHGTQSDDHADFAVSKNDLGLGLDEKCAEWVTKICENVKTNMAIANGEDGRTTMRTTYQCERQTINGRTVRLLKP